MSNPVSEYPGQQTNGGSKKIVLAVLAGVGVLVVAGAAILYFVFGKPYLTPKRTVVFEPDVSQATEVRPADLVEDARILTQRWRALGYSYPLVSFTVTDKGFIVGQIPNNIEDGFIERTKAVGLVEFVDFGDTNMPVGATVSTDFGIDPAQEGNGTIWHTIMTNREMQTVNVSTGMNGDFQIEFSLSENGRSILADFTSAHTGSYLGIIEDKVVISCPQINSPITAGKGVINGSFTKASANDLAAILSTSPLPVPLK